MFSCNVINDFLVLFFTIKYNVFLSLRIFVARGSFTLNIVVSDCCHLPSEILCCFLHNQIALKRTEPNAQLKRSFLGKTFSFCFNQGAFSNEFEVIYRRDAEITFTHTTKGTPRTFLTLGPLKSLSEVVFCRG